VASGAIALATVLAGQCRLATNDCDLDRDEAIAPAE
jgi:hypothetical protein